ncbi:MAG: glycosyltransferase, partial [Candidatus Aminicenantes bacterium]|nr:glycosyltransferase [Candidatus Aminicenantes bacterium]
MLVLDALYLLLLLLSWPFWLTYVLKRSYRSLLRGRLRPQLEPSDTGSIWIHAVSVGEVRSLRSLVDALGQSGRRVVLSVTTPAGFASARREFPSLPVIHSPFDLSFVVRRFIGRINPRLVIFNELEVWPNWIWLLHRRRIPMLLINGRVSLAAFRRYRLFQCILRPFFLRIDAFLVQSQIYRQRFLRLRIPPERIHVCGNIKADEAERGAQELPPPGEVRAHLRLPAPERKIVVLASSHASDEAVFIPAIASRSRDFLFIIVPRHVQRAPGIAARLQRGGIAAALFSRLPEGEGAGPPFQVLIYDLVGYLFAIMSIAEIVFMGGTCDARLGGHNLYEPAALG